MELRRLGRTGLLVPPIGFGAFKIGRNEKVKYAEGYALPDDDAVTALLGGLLDAGITLLDTAPAYGTSEERIGRFLKETGRREEIVLCSKVGERFADGISTYAFDAASVAASVEESLRALGTEHIDVMTVHSDGDDLRIIRETDVLEALQACRDAGKIGHIGFSGKTLEGHRACLEQGAPVDVLMVELHPGSNEQAAILPEASARDVGVLVKKGLGSGSVPAADAIPWVLHHEEVASILVGSLSLAHMRENLETALR